MTQPFDPEVFAKAMRKIVGRLDILEAEVKALRTENRNLIAKNAELAGHLARMEHSTATALCKHIDELMAEHTRAQQGLEEVVAGHEVALIALGQDPEPVRLVITPDLELDAEPPPVEPEPRKPTPDEALEAYRRSMAYRPPSFNRGR